MGGGVDAYRAVGAAVSVASAVATLAVYSVLGLHPLIAVFLGAALAGLSMALTPRQPGGGKGFYGYSETLAALLELLGVEGEAVYAPSSAGMVLVCVGAACGEGAALTPRPGGLGVSLPSPFSSMVSGFEPPCRPVDVYKSLVEELGLAGGVECVESAGRIACRLKGARRRVPESLEARLGSPEASLLATVAARCLDKPIKLLHDSLVGGGRRVIEVGVVG